MRKKHTRICCECHEREATVTERRELRKHGKLVRIVEVHRCELCDPEDAAWSAAIYSGLRQLRGKEKDQEA